MTKPKRQTEFDQAVEQARLAYLAQDLSNSGVGVGWIHAIEPLNEVTNRKPRVYASPNVVKETGRYYDLEFCMWLQRNYDYLLEYYQQNPDFKLWQGSKA